ncbi:MAG: hypothetical protein HUN04_09040 [Desulfobacter sp.]|nr:MAG: hypothetical protein HUN04_09040 [Desulfobacter sp.]
MNDFLQSLRNNQAEKPRTPKTRKSYDNSYQYSSGPRFHSYGGSGYGGNTRPPQMKRQQMTGMPQGGNQMPAEDPNTTLLADVLDNLNTQIDTLVKNQEYMITVQERTADLLQRQADAIEMVMAHLNMTPDMGLAEPNFENHYVSSQEPEDEMDGTVEELLKAEMEEERRKREAASQPKPVLRKRRKVVSRTALPAKKAAQPKADGKLMPREEIMEIIDSMREEGATYDQVAKRLIDLGQPTFSGRGEWHAQTIHRLCSRK